MTSALKTAQVTVFVTGGAARASLGFLGMHVASTVASQRHAPAMARAAMVSAIVSQDLRVMTVRNL